MWKGGRTGIRSAAGIKMRYLLYRVSGRFDVLHIPKLCMVMLP
jgi:hypothetical protein